MEIQPEKPEPSNWVKERQVPKINLRIIVVFSVVCVWCVFRLFFGLNLLTLEIHVRPAYYTGSWAFQDRYNEGEEFFDTKVVYHLWSPNEGTAYYANTSDSNMVPFAFFPLWTWQKAGEATKENGVWMHKGEPVFGSY